MVFGGATLHIAKKQYFSPSSLLRVTEQSLVRNHPPRHNIIDLLENGWGNSSNGHRQEEGGGSEHQVAINLRRRRRGVFQHNVLRHFVNAHVREHAVIDDAAAARFVVGTRSFVSESDEEKGRRRSSCRQTPADQGLRKNRRESAPTEGRWWQRRWR